MLIVNDTWKSSKSVSNLVPDKWQVFSLSLSLALSLCLSVSLSLSLSPSLSLSLSLYIYIYIKYICYNYNDKYIYMLGWAKFVCVFSVRFNRKTQMNFLANLINKWASLVAQLVKNLPAMWEIRVWFLYWEDPLKKGMATCSSLLAWRSPWTEEPGELQSMGSKRVERGFHFLSFNKQI